MSCSGPRCCSPANAAAAALDGLGRVWLRRPRQARDRGTAWAPSSSRRCGATSSTTTSSQAQGTSPRLPRLPSTCTVASARAIGGQHTSTARYKSKQRKYTNLTDNSGTANTIPHTHQTGTSNIMIAGVLYAQNNQLTARKNNEKKCKVH